MSHTSTAEHDWHQHDDTRYCGHCEQEERWDAGNEVWLKVVLGDSSEPCSGYKPEPRDRAQLREAESG